MAKKKRSQRVSPLAEFRAQLDELKQEKSLAEMRLRADIAGDTAEELFVKLRKQLRRVSNQARRYEKRSDRWHNRLTDLLHDICTGSVILPRPPGVPSADHDRLTHIFRQLKTIEFPDLAQTLRTTAGTGEPLAYQRFLAEEILIKGGSIVAEHLIRNGAAHPDRTGEDFIDRLRHHVAGNVCHGLARLVKYQVSPDVGKLLDQRILTALKLLEDLLTATPAGRLLIPRPDAPFDAERHDVAPGRPATGELKVVATLFPGYIVLSDPPRVIEKALVATERVTTPPNAAQKVE